MLLYAVFIKAFFSLHKMSNKRLDLEEIKTDLLFSSKNCSQIMNLLVDHL